MNRSVWAAAALRGGAARVQPEKRNGRIAAASETQRV